MSRIVPSARSSAAYIAALALIAAPSVVRGSVVVSSPDLPPESGVFAAPSLVAAQFTGPGIDIMLKCLIHRVIPGTVVRTSSGTDELAVFDTELLTSASVNGGPDVPIVLNGLTRTAASGWPIPVPPTATVPIEILSMDLVGNTPFGPIMIRESPTLPSQGHTTVQDMGGGLYQIDSFFDVFTELSIDGGASWIPSTGPTHIELLPRPPIWGVPEPASFVAWSLLGLALAGYHWRRPRG